MTKQPINCNELTAVVILEPIDLSHRIPLSDPGGFRFVQLTQIKVAELQFERFTPHDLPAQIALTVEASDFKHIIFNLDLHSWWAADPNNVSTLTQSLAELGLSLQTYGKRLGQVIPITSSREAAIEGLLRDREQQLTKAFSW
jgi:hypothetical protein